MKPKEYSISKISKPCTPAAVKRERLFAKIDENRDKNKITWLSGPGGAGKTILAASYTDDKKLPCLWYTIDSRDEDIATFFYFLGLAGKWAAPKKRRPLPLFTPEYAMGVPAFTLRFFEELFLRLSSPYILVFDNYQNLPENSPVHQIICDGIEAAPNHVDNIIISRKNPPAAYARFQARSMLNLLSFDQLSFTRDEIKEFIVHLQKKKGDDAFVSALFKQTRGWAAGLVLCLEASDEDDKSHQFNGNQIQKIFDYFAVEIFNNLDETLRTFLIKTSCLPRVNPTLAEKLTGISPAAPILSSLCDQHVFTTLLHQAKEEYQYHDLFRAFLLSQLTKTFSKEECTAIKKKAAAFLGEEGSVEDAVNLLYEICDWEGLIPFILHNAEEMASQGRFAIVEQWIRGVPKDILDKTPPLLFWLGICRMPYDPIEAKDFFENAFYTCPVSEPTLRLLSCSCVIQAICYAHSNFELLDGWIPKLNDEIRAIGSIPAGEIEETVTTSMFGALLNRQALHPDFHAWLKRAAAIAENRASTSPNRLQTLFNVCFYYISFTGDLRKAEYLIDIMYDMIKNMKRPDFAMSLLLFLEMFYYNVSVNHDLIKETCKKAIDCYRSTGIYLNIFLVQGLGAWGMLDTNDYETAKELLKKMKPMVATVPKWQGGLYYFLSARLFVITGDRNRAFDYSMIAVDYVPEGESGQHGNAINLLQHAYILHTVKEFSTADTYITKYKQCIKPFKNPLLDFTWYAISASMQFDLHKTDKGLAALRTCLTIGKVNRYYYFYIWIPNVMARLFKIALLNNIEKEYVISLIKKRGLLPDRSALTLEEWPFPIKIYTMGRFSLLKDNRSLLPSGKVPKHIVMLKAIIALGGRDVTDAEITDALWPEADGYLGHKAFSTTLYRLRLIFGDNEIVHFHDGKLSLDSRYCWVDIWEFEQKVNAAEEKLKTNRNEEAAEQMKKAIEICRGYFLAKDSSPWTVVMRERLRDRFIEAVRMVGTYYMKNKENQKVISIFKKGIETDPLAEELYRDFILHYAQYGNNKAEIKRVYNRLRQTLQVFCKTEPSFTIEELCS